MVDKSRETYERNGVEIIVDSDGILWLNKKHIEEGLNHENQRVTTVKHPSTCRKHRYELEDEPKNNTTEFSYTKNQQQK